MSLLAIIENQMKDSLKNGDQLLSSTLRMLKSDIMYEKAKTGKEPSEETVLEIITRAAKRRKESIAEFEKASRHDLAEREKAELEIIEKFLPEQMSGDEIAAYVDKYIAGLGEFNKAAFGKVMGPLMKDLKGKADGALVKQILTEKLESK
ncbi:MAG: GatB/YqeY domain-containing protein [Spirochaetes bacterium]|nr:GatB/YqeY domain-containing protein [Spirochaetota bacterium]